jgi:hypothetical protein
MTEQLEGAGDNENPMALVGNLMQSGFFTKFMGDLQTKFSSGEMDIGRLMGTVTNVISEAAPEGESEATEIRDFVNNSLGQMTALTGGGGLPPELTEQMGNMMNALGAGTGADNGGDDN